MSECGICKGTGGYRLPHGRVEECANCGGTGRDYKPPAASLAKKITEALKVGLPLAPVNMPPPAARKPWTPPQATEGQRIVHDPHKGCCGCPFHEERIHPTGRAEGTCGVSKSLLPSAYHLPAPWGCPLRAGPVLVEAPE